MVNESNALDLSKMIFHNLLRNEMKKNNDNLHPIP